MLEDKNFNLSRIDYSFDEKIYTSFGDNETALDTSEIARPKSKTPTLYHHRKMDLLRRKEKHTRKNNSKDFKPKTFKDIDSVINYLSTKTPEWHNLKAQLRNPAANNNIQKLRVLSEGLCHEKKLGPGSYIPNTPTPGPCFRFSPTPRFTSTEEERADIVYPRSLYLSESRRVQINKTIKKNKNLSKFTPEEFKNLLSDKFKEKKEKELQIREVKKFLDEKKHEEMMNKYLEKQKRYEQFRYKKEYDVIGKAWILLAFSLGISTALHYKYIHFVKTQKNKARLNSLFRSVSKSIGRISRRMKTHKMQKALETIKRLLIPYIRKRAQQRKGAKEARIVCEVIERMMFSKKIFSLIFYWRGKIKLVQKIWKDAYMIRKAKLKTLKKLWQKIEKELHKKYTQAHGGARSWVPPLVRNHFIKEFLKSHLFVYASESKIYNQKVDKITKEFLSSVIERDMEEWRTGKKIYLQDKLPPKPILKLYTDKATMKSLVEKAEKSRLQWDRIIQLEKKILKKIDINHQKDLISILNGTEENKEETTENEVAVTQPTEGAEFSIDLSAEIFYDPPKKSKNPKKSRKKIVGKPKK